MRSSTKLTLRTIDAAKAEATDYFIWDREVSGFGVRVRTTGTKSYVLQYRVAGRSRRYTIGTAGSPWTPETARKEALRLLGHVTDDVDVQEEKTSKRHEMTVAMLCDLYLTEGLVTRKQSSINAARSDIENHIKPRLGSRKVTSIVRADVEKLLADIAAGKTASNRKTTKKRGRSRVRGGRGAANSATQVLSAALGFAVARNLRTNNPAIGVRRFPEQKGERFLSPAELARLGEALAAADAMEVEGVYGIAAIRLLALTGCRRAEILTLKRSYLDRHNSCFRLPDSKTGAKVVHVGDAVFDLIDMLPRIVGNDYVLPGRDGGHLVNVQKPWDRVRKAAGLEDVRLHDLRHSFASVGADNGDSLLIIGALLGHKSSKTTERYAHLSDHPLKGAAQRISGKIADALGLAPSTAPSPAGSPLDAFNDNDIDGAWTILGFISKTKWMDTNAVAARLGLTRKTLETYRWLGTGPEFHKVGRRVVYAEEAVTKWIAAQAAA